MRPSRPLLDGALLFGGALIAGFAALRGINPHDEGLMLAAADRIARGELPWRDFWWNYGPAEPYALAGLQELFGRSLLVWRVAHVALAAVAGLMAHILVRREAPLPYALTAWACVVAALSFPLIPNPLTPAITLALATLLIAPRRPVAAGALAGLAVAFRLDVGLAAVASGVLAATQGRSAARTPRRTAPQRKGGREAGKPRADLRAGARTLAAAVAVAALAVGPVAIAAGMDRWADQTIGFALWEQSLQRLPLPLDGDGTGDLNKSFEHLFPTLSLLAFALVLAVTAVRWARRRWRLQGLALSALPLSAAGALYVLARADDFHVSLLQATLPLVAAPLLARERGRNPRSLVAIGALGLALLLPLLYSIDRKAQQALRPPPLAPIDVDVADGVRTEPRDARALGRLVPFVRARVAPGRPVFIANPRHDLVRVGDPLLSVLIGRRNPTRYLVMQPGVLTRRDVQREIVGDLRRSRTSTVVRWRSPVADEREPNGAGRSSGVRVLDRFLRRSYRPLRRFGDYDVLTLRRSGPLR